MIELIFGVILLWAMMLFTLVVGRGLAERNRILAANRTVAWLAVQQRGGKEAETFPPQEINRAKDFHLLLRKWHFKTSGPAAGVVRIEHGAENWRSGVLSGAADFATSIHDQMSGSGGTFAEESIDNAADGSINDPIHGQFVEDGDKSSIDDKPTDHAGDFLSGAVNSFMAFIGGDYYKYSAEVTYYMPLLFSRSAYEFIFGDFAEGDVDTGDRIVAVQVRDGETYCLLNRHGRDRCVFPLVDAGGENAMTELRVGLNNMIENAKQELESVADEGLYRPHAPVPTDSPDDNNLPDMANSRSQGDLEAVAGSFTIPLEYEAFYNANPGFIDNKKAGERLMAILIYEYHDYDSGIVQKNARDGKVSGWPF